MNQIVDAATIVSAVPLQMSRHDKLMHWAKLIRASGKNVYLLSNLEHLKPYHLREPIHAVYSWEMAAHSAFGLAAARPGFKEQGYKGKSIQHAMDFFKLTQKQLHEFSCDCGGSISNETMARRIENIAIA